MKPYTWIGGLLNLLACGQSSVGPVATSDAAVFLPPRSFVEQEIAMPAAPTAPTLPSIATFGACSEGEGEGEGDLCFPFAMPQDIECTEGEFLYPSATHCLPLASCLEAFPAAANVIFVDDDAASGGDGSHAHPFQSIQAGINAAANGSTVRVQPGRYLERIVIGRNVTVEGACPTTTTITMSSPAPANARHIVQLDSGTIRGFRVIGHTDGRAQNWGGIVANTPTPVRVQGLLLQHLQYGIYVGRTASLEAEDMRSDFAAWNNLGVLTARRSQFVSRQGTVFPIAGSLTLSDVFMRGHEEGATSAFVGISANDNSALGGPVASGQVHLDRLVVLAPTGLHGSKAVHVEGSVELDLSSAFFGVDAGLVVRQSAKASLSNLAIAAREYGLHASDSSEVTIENARVVGLFDEEIQYEWDGAQEGLALLGASGVAQRIYVGHLVGVAIAGSVDHLDRPTRLEDIVVEDIQRSAADSGGFGVVGGNIELHRASFRALEAGASALRLDASDVSVSQARYGLVGFDLNLTRVATQDVAFGAAGITGIELTDGNETRRFDATNLPWSELHFLLHDGSFTRGIAAIAAEHVSRVEISRVTTLAMETSILLTDNGSASVEDVFVRESSPPEEGVAMPSIANVRSPLVGRRLRFELGRETVGGLSFEDCPVDVSDYFASGGYFGIYASVDEENPPTVRFLNTRIESTEAGVWMDDPLLSNAFRSVRFFDVGRTLTLGTLPVPTVPSDLFDFSSASM